VTESDELARISHSRATERERRREGETEKEEEGAREGENEPATVMEADLPSGRRVSTCSTRSVTCQRARTASQCLRSRALGWIAQLRAVARGERSRRERAYREYPSTEVVVVVVVSPGHEARIARGIARGERVSE
jgi:hypothetical protein